MVLRSLCPGDEKHTDCEHDWACTNVYSVAAHQGNDCKMNPHQWFYVTVPPNPRWGGPSTGLSMLLCKPCFHARNERTPAQYKQTWCGGE